MFLHRSGNTWYQKAQTYYDSQNHDLAFLYFTKAAKSNHTLAQVFLGHMYEHGQGTMQDDTEALHWYTQAKETSDAEHQLVIAYMYHDGDIGGISDHKKSLDWFQASDKNGNPRAYSCIAILYGTGKGTEKDCKLALSSSMQFEKDKSSSNILVDVATTYLFGKHSVDQDFDEAESWFIKGVDKEEEDAMFGMGLLYAIRTDRNQCWKKAYLWYTEAAKHNHDRAQCALGWLYQHGLGCRKNYTIAMQWYKKAKKNGNQDAIAYIASFYHYGYSVPVDYLKALSTYETAINNANALNGKGLMYQSGSGVIQSHSVAMSYFKIAADLGYSEAFNSIAEVYQHGYGRDVDLNKAFSYYTKSAACIESVSSKGMFNLGLMYLEGLGTEIDQRLALVWLRKAATYGNKRASEYIDQLVKSSTQLPQIIYNTERIQVIMKERILQGIQLQTLQEKLASLTTENELLKKMVTNNGTKRTEPLKFLYVQNTETIDLEKAPKKFLQI